MVPGKNREGRPVRLLADVLITIAAVILAFLALDDITTGRETDFTAEYVAVIACAAWLLWIGSRLLKRLNTPIPIGR